MATKNFHSAATERELRADDFVSSSALAEHYRRVRRATERLAAPLTAEDCAIQSMPDVSPTKWHLAHTTWFFETLILSQSRSDYRPYHSDFRYLFNSYYNTIGDQFDRPSRGVLSRPSLEEIYRYRAYVDRHLLEFIESADAEWLRETGPVILLGLNHEQQHQELILTDIKHVFWNNPLRPAYREIKTPEKGPAIDPGFVSFPANLYHIGHVGSGFTYDNECPRHKMYVGGFEIARRLVTNGEYLEFMADCGYERSEFWLSDGWKTVQSRGWKAPLYWEPGIDSWQVMTLGGMRKVDPSEPLSHVSYFEADAFARWAEARLPTESEWEVAARGQPVEGNLLESDLLHPSAESGDSLIQLFGDVWEWTRSAYSPYPGYRPATGALGEYNAKFMSGQMVLRGGSCATPAAHIRSTYRNFMPPDARWQFMGLRLARDT